MKKALIIVVLLWPLPMLAQSTTGELRLTVADPAGLGVRATVNLASQGTQYSETFVTNQQGNVDAKRLPYGIYHLQIQARGFAAVSESVEIRSALPMDRKIQLQLAPVSQSVQVTDTSTLMDPYRPGSVNEIGSEQIQNRLTAIPGRSIQDLVNSQPGWLYEGNAVLHPRGSEYQTQFVVDGIPLTDNRSPSFGPDIEADDVQSMSIYTAGIPAEYGRKMGGVVEVNTMEDSQPGFHGQVVLSGGSFDTAGAFAEGQYVWGKNTLGASASGSMTDHYLNPVVPENFTNTGTLGDFSLHYQRQLTPNDRLSLIVRHELSRYELPNEFVQQTPHDIFPLDPTAPLGSQRQTADNIETMGVVSYQHTFSPNVVMDLHGMVRDNANDFNSNDYSTPIEVFQHNFFREGYFKGTVTAVRGRHEFKFGVESDNTFLHENFSYNVTDPYVIDDDTPPAFIFLARRPDLEQSAIVQDLIQLGKWT